MKLTTTCLDLIAATIELLQAELVSTEKLASFLNTQIESGWPPGEYDRGAQEFFLNQLQENGNKINGWYVWYAVLRGNSDQASTLIGAAGYFGPPNDEGTVEIGFSVMPKWQGKGLATEITEALIAHAFEDDRVKKIIAHTTPENVASCKILEKCGFSFISQDEETGYILFSIDKL